ncbi:putative pentatricopeptide [Rosa chinensis]|uniref:Putative pentatricopeptide n=1 Tax=Rosa chinensis TaxID=74649 RepID=A0A2P6QPY6_ROSCH|nr:putative pentatricopeptide [Rosa chinensis]
MLGDIFAHSVQFSLNKYDCSIMELIDFWFHKKWSCEVSLEMFSEMPKSNLVSWNTIIGALFQESKFGEAIELFRVMQTEGIKGDRVTMVEAASACEYLGTLGHAKWIHAYIEKKQKTKLTLTCGSTQL